MDKKITIVLLLGMIWASSAVAAHESWASQFPVGSTFPDIVATDQDGTERNLDDLSGEHGFLFLFNRSVVW